MAKQITLTQNANVESEDPIVHDLIIQEPQSENLNILIGIRVGELRTIEKMSKKDMADFLDLSPATYFAKEKGVDASFTTRELLNLSLKFKVPVDTLFCQLSLEDGLAFNENKAKLEKLKELEEKMARALDVIQNLQRVIAAIEISF